MESNTSLAGILNGKDAVKVDVSIDNQSLAYLLGGIFFVCIVAGIVGGIVGGLISKKI